MRFAPAVLIVLAACTASDITGPEPQLRLAKSAKTEFRAKYDMVAWGGGGLPIIVTEIQVSPGVTELVYVAGGQLHLLSNGRWRMQVDLLFECVVVETGEPCGTRSGNAHYRGTYVFQYDEICGDIPRAALLTTTAGLQVLAVNFPFAEDCPTAEFGFIDMLPISLNTEPVFMSGSEWVRTK